MPTIRDVPVCGVWVVLAAVLATASLRVLLYGVVGPVSPLVSVLCSALAAAAGWLAVAQIEIPEEDRAILRSLIIAAVTPTLAFFGDIGGLMPSWCMALWLMLTQPTRIGALVILLVPAMIAGATTWRLLTAPATGHAVEPA